MQAHLPSAIPCSPLLDLGKHVGGCTSHLCSGSGALAETIPKGKCNASDMWSDWPWSSCVAICTAPKEDRGLYTQSAPSLPGKPQRHRHGRSDVSIAAAGQSGSQSTSHSYSDLSACAPVDAALVARMTRHLQERLARNRRMLDAHIATNNTQSCTMRGDLEVSIAVRSPGGGLRVSLTYLVGGLKPSGRYRADGFARVLLDAIKPHVTELRRIIMRAEPPELTLFFFTSDFTGDGLKFPLPGLFFSSSASSRHLAVPDFTLAHFPHALTLLRRSAQNGTDAQPLVTFDEVSRTLLSREVSSASRGSVVAWRGTLNAAPTRDKRLPPEQRQRRRFALDTFQSLRTQLRQLGLRADVSGKPLSMQEMCDAKYQLHVDGTSASNSLKCRLACGNVVLRVKALNSVGRFVEPQLEYWELLQPPEAGVEWVELEGNLTNAVPELTRLQREPGLADAIGRKGREYVRRVLSPEAVSCFWLQLLREYATIYAQWRGLCRGLPEVWRRSARTAVAENTERAFLAQCYPWAAGRNGTPAWSHGPCFRSWNDAESRHFSGASDAWSDGRENMSAMVVPVVYDLF